MKPPARDDRAVTADLATIAFLARLAVIVYALAEPVWDGYYYDVGARRIAAGLGYSEALHVAAPNGGEEVLWHAWAHYPVGYPAFLAFFYRLFGTSIVVAPLVNALTGAALAAVVHRVALRAFDDDRRGLRAFLAALLVALHPGLVLYSGALMTEPLAALGMLLAILFASSKARGSIASGVVLGLTTLVRPNAILMAPFLGRGRVARWLLTSCVVGAVAMLTVMPWTARNCRTMDACAFVSTNAGWNLVIGSGPGATGKFEYLVGHVPADAPDCIWGGQVAQDKCWFRYGARTIAKDPRRWLGLVPAKLHYTLDEEWAPINYLREARPDLVSEETHLAWGRFLTHANALVLAAAALANVGRPRGLRDRWWPVAIQLAAAAAIVALAAYGIDEDPHRVWPLGVLACVLPFVPIPGAPPFNATLRAIAGVVLTTLLTHAIFFGEDRYHLVATPALIVIACGLGRLAAPTRKPASSRTRALEPAPQSAEAAVAVPENRPIAPDSVSSSPWIATKSSRPWRPTSKESSESSSSREGSGVRVVRPA